MVETAAVYGPQFAADALLDLGESQLERGEAATAAATFDRLDREHPASAAAREAAPRLKALAAHLPAPSDQERAQRTLHKGEALLEQGGPGPVVA